jgi:hypothetical protein
MLGERVLVAARGAGPSRAALQLADALAGTDGGIVDVVIIHTEGEQTLDAGAIRSLERTVFRGSMDGVIRTVVDRTLADAVAHAALTHPPTALIVDGSSVPVDEDLAPLARHLAEVPTLLVRGDDVRRGAPVVLVANEPAGAGGAAARTAGILAGGRGGRVDRAASDDFAGVAAGSVVVIAAPSWSAVDEHRLPDGAVQVTVIDP